MDQLHSYKYNKDYNGIQQFRRSLLMKNLELQQSPYRAKKSNNFERQQSSIQLQTLSNLDQLKDVSNGFINNPQFNNGEVEEKTQQIQSQQNQNISKQIHQKRFLPFIQERDSIGRLISKSIMLGPGDGSQSEKLRHESYKYLLKKSINENISKSPKQKGNKQQMGLLVNQLFQKKNISISQPQSSNNLQDQSPINFQKGFTINQDKIKGYCNVIDKVSPLSKQIATKRGSLQNGNTIDISQIASKQSISSQPNTHKRHSSELNLASMIFRNLSINNNSQQKYLSHLQYNYQQQNYERKHQKQQLENDFSAIEITQIQDKSQADQKSLTPMNNSSILSELKNHFKDKKNNNQICQSLDRQDKSQQNTSKSLLKLQNSDNGQSVINLSKYKFIKVDPKIHMKKQITQQKAKQQINMHSNYFFNGNKQPLHNNHSQSNKMNQFQKENEENFTELFKGVKVSQQYIDRFVKNELSYFENIQKNDEEKIANFEQESVTKFVSGINILKNRARKLKKNINQMSENAMNNLNEIDSQYNYKYSIPIQF
ncbi:hypothetical protein TTHERM_00486590 (macronuclear) [Tetrahymena thermophila SB210]|uniref:Uncharacterized protein n=1 Tax=Tetrahymena thermophila (strain SB210) TaxID=312017 RepID=I7MGI9_TETTS|nr:hypothetical protein TTHERM_00486590 [Tetrahymena thermophila SB210]EAR85208.2 hypothetical protein TTHERM_00486590 [Tetrahymena thermophila SB210]|eukprot:XP_001032871.2 hypothetical protein TTHERM_00486590 [Tetrahymena thermophila SB210]